MKSSITKRVVVKNANQQRQRFLSAPPVSRYHIPKTLSELMANDQEIDFAMACLLIARSSMQDLFQRDIDIRKPLREIDTIANDIQQKIHNNLSVTEVIQVIAHHLYQKMNYTSSRNIWDHSNLYLNLVLEGRQGYCLGFVQLWLSLGQRLNYQGKKLHLVAIQSHMSMGNYKQALRCIEKARDILPQKSIDLAMLQADTYRLSGQYKQSIQFCDSYINSHRGRHIDNYILMTIKKIRCYTQMKQYKKAYALCEFVLQSKIKSYYPDIYPKMGIIHVHMGNFSEANKYFDKSAQIEYGDSEIFYGKALIAIQKKQYKKALMYLEEAMAYNVTDIDVQRAFKELQKLPINNTP